MKRVIYSDPTPWWVPIVTIVIICGMVWFAGVWNEDGDIGTITTATLVIGGVLLVASAFQGVLYWKDQIAELSETGAGIEAKIMRWIGPGRRFGFQPLEATDWEIVEKPLQKVGDAAQASTITFSVRGQTFRMSVTGPEILDLEAMRRVAPGIIAELLANYPQVVSKPATA